MPVEERPETHIAPQRLLLENPVKVSNILDGKLFKLSTININNQTICATAVVVGVYVSTGSSSKPNHSLRRENYGFL